jgi:hypothetical protein
MRFRAAYDSTRSALLEQRNLARPFTPDHRKATELSSGPLFVLAATIQEIHFHLPRKPRVLVKGPPFRLLLASLEHGRKVSVLGIYGVI